MFAAFIEAGSQSGRYKLLRPDGTEVECSYSARLTDREREVLTLLDLGENNSSIAALLHLSPETVRSHTRSARTRLGARSRSHAIALAISSGQIAPDPDSDG